MTTAVRTERTSLDHSFARFLRMIVTGTFAAGILNFLAWWLIETQMGTILMSQPLGQEVQNLGLVTLLLLGLVSAIGAALLYWILDRITNAPRLWFIIASIVVLVLGYFGPANLESVSTAAKNGLQILHLTTAVGIIWAVAYVAGWFPIRDRSA